jgi:hypothetical protein
VFLERLEFDPMSFDAIDGSGERAGEQMGPLDSTHLAHMPVRFEEKRKLPKSLCPARSG